MNRTRTSTYIIWIVIIILAFLAINYFGTAHAATSDKYDGDCTANTTDGRCADKCPAGSYSIGTDKATGAVVCKANPTGCPYGDSVPLGPECDKLAPAVLPSTNESAQASITPDVPAISIETDGK